jgi:hypothetical protein
MSKEIKETAKVVSNIDKRILDEIKEIEKLNNKKYIKHS